MNTLYADTSFKISQITTQAYSTSFSIAVSYLSKDMQRAIYSIYGFVRFADEIVDTFLEYNQKKILNDFERDLYEALEQKISLNPILNSFVITVHRYNIPVSLINSFLDSMKADLHKTDYSNAEELDQYIYGSADVVGLMCLYVFTNGDKVAYHELEFSAKKLGSAFQKVNFLRDLKSDIELLNRQYFPGFSYKEFDEEKKLQIVNSIIQDFEEAKIGLKKLPKDARLAVYIAYTYYLELLKKIQKKPASQILSSRIRLHGFKKIMLLAKALVLNSCNLI